MIMYYMIISAQLTFKVVNPHQADVSESLIRPGGGQICPTKEIGYIGYIFALYSTKMGSRDSGETKVDPHWVQDPIMLLKSFVAIVSDCFYITLQNTNRNQTQLLFIFSPSNIPGHIILADSIVVHLPTSNCTAQVQLCPLQLPQLLLQLDEARVDLKLLWGQLDLQ